MIDETIELPLNRDPYTLPVTIETWDRLPIELLRFYADGRTAPTELAARVLLNQAQRSLERSPVVQCDGAVRRRQVLQVGRKGIMSAPDYRKRAPMYSPALPVARGA